MFLDTFKKPKLAILVTLAFVMGWSLCSAHLIEASELNTQSDHIELASHAVETENSENKAPEHAQNCIDHTSTQDLNRKDNQLSDFSVVTTPVAILSNVTQAFNEETFLTQILLGVIDDDDYFNKQYTYLIDKKLRI